MHSFTRPRSTSGAVSCQVPKRFGLHKKPRLVGSAGPADCRLNLHDVRSAGPAAPADGGEKSWNFSCLASGFTLLEVIVALSIVGILAALAIGNYERIVASAQQAACASNMRSIHHGLGLYLQDNKDVWPQGPDIMQEKAWEQFWLQALEPLGVAPRTWQCPTIRGMLRSRDNEATKVHYVPTGFDPTPGIARRWPTQPWLIERADAHGQGPLICFPDGSIRPMQRVLYEQGMLRR